MTKKKVLVFINDSLGELDWIQPFLSSYSNKYNFFVYLYLAKKSKDEKREIFKSYFGNNCQIVHLDDEIYYSDIDSTDSEQYEDEIQLTKGLDERE